MQLIFLGTGSMVPTKERNVNSIFLKHEDKGLLFDVGEGTQRQMNIKGIKRTLINYIFLTHWHGDHMAGLLPLLMTLSNSEKDMKIKIFGPKHSKEKFEHLKKSSYFDKVLDCEIIEVDAIKEKTILENENFYISCINVEHSVPCLAYSFNEKDKYNINIKKAEKLGLKEGPDIGILTRKGKIIINKKTITLEEVSILKKGKKITIIIDTGLNNNLINFAKDSDVLICESTYHSQLEEKAEDHTHLTSKDAAMIALHSNTKKLVLTHFSQRYKTVKELEEDAKLYFPNTVCAEDFMSLKF